MKKPLLVLFALATALLAGGCNDLAEPVAITPDDVRPAIVTDLNVNVNEDGSVTIDVEADDPNGEAMTLAITTPPQHGTAVLEDHRAQEAAVARTVPLPSKRPFEVISEKRRGEISEQPARAAPDAAPHQAAAKDGPATQTATKAATIHAAVRLVSGAESRNTAGQAVLVGRIRYTPEADFNGTDRLAFTVRNTSGFASEAEATLTVIAEPDAPRIDQDLDDINLAPGQRITLNLRTEKVFADPDGDALSFSVLSRDAAIATAEVTGDEVLTVQALNAPNQATLIDVTATDTGGLSATTSFTVTVEASDNQPPRVETSITDRALTVGETFDVALTTVFTDDDGDALTFTATSSNPAVAQAEILPLDTLRVTMLATGVATITITANDGIATAQTTLTVFLNPGVNAADDTAETDEDTPVVIDVLENDRDSNNGPVTVAGFLSPPANGTAEIIDDAQRVRYSPNPSFFGEDSFIYIAGNEQGNLSQATVSVTVRENNRPPEVIPLDDQNNTEGEAVSLQIQATDFDTPLHYTSATLPPGLDLDAGSGLITDTLATDAAGLTGTMTYAVTVFVIDNRGGQSSTMFDWTVTNPAPLVTDPGAQNSTAADSVALQIQATDDDTLTYAASGLPPGLNIDTKTGEISGVIDLETGSDTPYAVEVTIADDQTGATSVSFDWFVDHPAPTLDSLSPTSATQSTTLDVTLTGSNFIDGVSSVSFSGTGITINATTINSDTEIVVNISIDAAAATGDRDVTVTNTGPGGGASATQTFTVTM